jgi:hypothetical protein
VDDDGDTQIDEALPPGAAAYDCDGDGFVGTSEVSVGTSDQDPCGSTGWPLDLDSLGASANLLNIGDLGSFIIPKDVHVDAHGNFNYFNHTVPDASAPNSARWNLDSTGASAAVINIGDLNAMNPSVTAPTARPPMFGGLPAFFTNGGQCPWPP